MYARRAKDKPLSESVSTFIVPTSTQGFSVARINDLMAVPTRANADVIFENVRIPERYLLSEVNNGYKIINCMKTLIILYQRGAKKKGCQKEVITTIQGQSMVGH